MPAVTTTIEDHTEHMYLGDRSQVFDATRMAVLQTNWLNLPPTIQEQIMTQRHELGKIMAGESNKIALMTGPCSAHDLDELTQMAAAFSQLPASIRDKVMIVLRAYFEKPRTTSIGSNGLPNYRGYLAHPDPLQREDVFVDTAAMSEVEGTLTQLAAMGVPVVTEFLNMESAAALGHLTTTVAIGARTVSDPRFVTMAQGLSAIGVQTGWKNDLTGDLTHAVAAINQLLGIAYPILRGGENGSNWEQNHRTTALEATGTHACVDAAHGNSGKDLDITRLILQVLTEQITLGRGPRAIMWETNTGLSLTDPGLPFEETLNIINQIAQANH